MILLQCQQPGVHGHNGVNVQTLVVVAGSRGADNVWEVTTVWETPPCSETVTPRVVLNVSYSDCIYTYS